MSHITAQQVAILFTVVLLIFGTRQLSRLLHGDDLTQLVRELKRRMPIFSAETTRGTEAEFIRDRLPRRLPAVLALIGVVVFATVAWWLSR
jgi:Sec-independent protein translocase protein TatA